MATSIFSPISGRSYSYGGFSSQPVNNIFSGVNPYYLNNNNTYTPTPLVFPTTPIVQPTYNYSSSGGDDSFPNNPPTNTGGGLTFGSGGTGFSFGNNISSSPGYDGPYNQGSPLSDLGGGIDININPGTILGTLASAYTGVPFLGTVGGKMYNEWDRLNYSDKDYMNQVGVAKPTTYSTSTANTILNQMAADMAAQPANYTDGQLTGGVSYAGTGGSDNFGYGAGSGYDSDGGYSGTDAGDAAAAGAGEEDSGGSGYAGNAGGGFW
jgi:hypothetical protein